MSDVYEGYGIARSPRQGFEKPLLLVYFFGLLLYINLQAV